MPKLKKRHSREVEEILDSLMPYEGVPDRRIGFVAGIVGGIFGMWAMRTYWRMIAPLLFQKEPKTLDTSASPLGKLYKHGESGSMALSRLGYEVVTGETPSPQLQSQLADLVLLGFGIGAGATYGGTRTTTRGRDIAGGFFYGIRLWLGDTMLGALSGLRPDPRNKPVEYHLRRLLAFWSFSFTTAQVTRILYRILASVR